MTLFSKIISGQIPSYKIFEDDLTFAFLDINPINLGHTLICPKIETPEIWDLEEPYYSALFKNSKQIAKAIQNATDCLRVCSWFEGFMVPHTHYHICPFYKSTGEFGQKKPEPFTESEMQQIQAKIIQSL